MYLNPLDTAFYFDLHAKSLMYQDALIIIKLNLIMRCLEIFFVQVKSLSKAGWLFLLVSSLNAKIR